MFGLNETCIPEKPFFVQIITDGITFLSIPVYFLAFFIIIFKCPSVFDKYRILLLRHLIACFLMEVHMGFFWQLSVNLPSIALCANGIAFDFPRIMFFVLIILILITAYSVFDLFDYRMEVVTTENQYKMKKGLKYFKYLTLFCMNSVHLSFVAFPTAIFLFAFFVKLPNDFMPLSYLCVALLTQHGSGSTVTLLTTNNSLRRVIHKLFFGRKLCRKQVITSSRQFS
ncbi:unnamed protein product [Caenorhabditis angaria]|uniref:Uncharacterized protein n=1 Tax=Caenorhabditis angaria TaxID=860376 RepID=A0A9P1ITI0_9PELO|nr:unnamed protein product [Caenorhabditis angaria]